MKPQNRFRINGPRQLPADIISHAQCVLYFLSKQLYEASLQLRGSIFTKGKIKHIIIAHGLSHGELHFRQNEVFKFYLAKIYDK